MEDHLQHITIPFSIEVFHSIELKTPRRMAPIACAGGVQVSGRGEGTDNTADCGQHRDAKEFRREDCGL